MQINFSAPQQMVLISQQLCISVCYFCTLHATHILGCQNGAVGRSSAWLESRSRPVPHVIDRATLFDSVGFLWGLRFPPTLSTESHSSLTRIFSLASPMIKTSIDQNRFSSTKIQRYSYPKETFDWSNCHHIM
jgi:hypothetical protein